VRRVLFLIECLNNSVIQRRPLTRAFDILIGVCSFGRKVRVSRTT
jgi:hypothetical protein